MTVEFSTTPDQQAEHPDGIPIVYPDKVAVVLQVNTFSKEDANTVLTLFFTTLVAAAEVNPENFPEVTFFEELGLLKKHPTRAKSAVHTAFALRKFDDPSSQIEEILSQMDSREILASIAEFGRYGAEFDEKLAKRVRTLLSEKRHKQQSWKEGYRKLKTLSKLMALRDILQSGDSSLVSFLLLGLTFGFWGVLDRAIADPEARSTAMRAALTVLLQAQPVAATGVDTETQSAGVEGHVEPPHRKTLASRLRRKVQLRVSTLVKAEATVDHPVLLESLDTWIARIHILLEAGVSPLLILEQLRRQTFHSPLFLTVPEAEVHIMEHIIMRLEELRTKAVQASQREALNPEAATQHSLDIIRHNRARLLATVITEFNQPTPA